MRIRNILLSIVFLFTAGDVFSQSIKAPIIATNVTIEQVLNRIEKASDYVFLFNDETLNTKKIVSVNNKNGNITEILDHIFRNTNIVYAIVDKQIILSVKKNNANKKRSEEHTSELQSRQYLVCRLLLEKKKKYIHI